MYTQFCTIFVNNLLNCHFMHAFLVILLALFCQLSVRYSDQQSFSDRVFDGKIRTVQLYKEGWNLSYPVMKLNSKERLVLHFDLLADQAETYYYTFIHCDKDWNRSDLSVNSYIEGFDENQIEVFKSSFNTTVNYIHYELAFPNERVRLNLSGNYVIVVYPGFNPDKPVLTRRFVVTEDAAGITADLRRPQMTDDNNRNQQVHFTVSFTGLTILDPYRNIYAFILQNGRWDRAKTNLKADLTGNNELKYNSLSDKNIFPGGNEFRYFDIRSIRYKSEFISRIDYVFPNYNILLHPSENREFKPYFYSQDFNGKYVIAVQEGQNHNTDADYVNVFFTLPLKYMLSGGGVYVTGAFNNWNRDDGNLMRYNHDNQAYECTIMLKQGWYNFEYAYLKEGTTDSRSDMFEGSHYQTENDYLILIYYRNPRDRYDRIIGSVVANTLNRISG